MKPSIELTKKYKTLQLSASQMERFQCSRSGMDMRISVLYNNLVSPQMDEIVNDEPFFLWCMVKSGIYEVMGENDVNSTLLWCLFMSNKVIMKTYNKKFNKGFWEVCPMSDIMDLYTFLIYYSFYLNNDPSNGLIEVLEADLLIDIDKENIKSLSGFLKDTGGLERECA